MIPDIGNILAGIVAALGILGGVLNISMCNGTRHTSYLIWSIGNGAGGILYILALFGILEINLGFAFLFLMNAIYTGIDIMGWRNTR